MDLRGWKYLTYGILLAGFVAAILGVILYIEVSAIGGVSLIIVAIVAIVIGASISGFLKTYDFYETVEMAGNKNIRKNMNDGSEEEDKRFQR